MIALSEYMSAAATRALAPEVAEHAKHHLIDTVAAMVSGSELLPGQASADDYIDLGENTTFSPEVMDGECSA